MKTLNERKDINLSQEEYKDLVTHDKWKDASKKFSSDQILAIVRKYSVEKAMEILSNLVDFRTVRQMNNFAAEISKTEKFESDYVDENPFE